MNLLEEKAREKEFIEQVKRQLYREVFLKEDISVERVDSLVRLLEKYNPTDEQEIRESRERFEKMMKQKFKKEYRKSCILRYTRQCATVVAFALFILVSANFVTQATVHKNFFDVILGRNNGEILDYEIRSEKSDKVFDSVEDVEQYLNQKLVLPENMMGMQVDEVHLNEFSEEEYGVYIRYVDNDSKYMIFNIRLLEYPSTYADKIKLDGSWKEVQFSDLKLSNVSVAIKGDNYRLHTFIDKAIYEIASDLPSEKLVDILNTIPLPSDKN